MKDITKAIITGAILGASLGLIADYAHAGTAVASANHGHHGYGAGVSGSLKGAPSSSSSAPAGPTGGNGGNGGSYFSPSLHDSLVDAYQPWPEAEVRQFQSK